VVNLGKRIIIIGNGINILDGREKGDN